VSTVLIAAPELLHTLKSRADLRSAEAFAEADALRALEVITRQRPGVVALERMFASSSRGAALINRIKADPELSACEIRIIESNGSAAPARAEAAAAEPITVVEPAPPPVAPLDQRGTRRAPRFKIADGVEVLVDRNPASLVDLSVVGAMVISPTILRPNQRVRVSLPDPLRPLRLTGIIAWAAFEMPKGGPRYRAGIEFLEPDTEAVARFIDSHKK
jgi:hypothetical protein